jgi:predicted P-loop ATPase/GTPase
LPRIMSVQGNEESSSGTLARDARHQQWFVAACSLCMELEEAARSGLPLELLNPVNRLSSPTLHREATEERLAFREFVAQRFTHYDGRRCRSIYYLNGTINTSRMRGMNDFFLAIKSNAEKTIFIRNFQQLVKAYVDNFERATGSCYRYLQDKPLIVESFNDAAYPFSRTEDCNVVLCVSSNTALRFKAREYFKAIELRGQQKPKAQLTTTDVYSSTLVERKYEFQPLTNDERRDPAELAANYSEIIDDLADDFKNRRPSTGAGVFQKSPPMHAIMRQII